MATAKQASAGQPTEPARLRRSRLSQEDVPAYSIEQAIRVPRAIAENYAYKPTRPMNVAGAMGMSPTSGPFRTITGSSVAYGLTSGAAQAPEIGITPLGMRAVRPTTEGDDAAARREALLRPKVVGDFLRSYDGAALPSDPIARNVLQDMGVPAERVEDVLRLIVDGAKSVGFLKEIGGKQYVDLAGQPGPQDDRAPEHATALTASTSVAASQALPVPAAAAPVVSLGPGIHVNIEIHIAADASSDTIEEIFRNMRRYVLTGDGPLEDDAASTR